MDQPQQRPIRQVIAAALVLLLSGVTGAGPAIGATGGTSSWPAQVQPWHEEDENNGNDHHPERHRGDHDHDHDDDHGHDDHDDDGGLDGLLDNLADVLEEVADLLEELL